GSILVNGSPTEEFQFCKGLKQGDPLSPFLFILIMESLHLSFQRVEDAGLFTGSISIFHMSIFKALVGVLRKLESIRSHFFNGHDLNCNKASWVDWKAVLSPKGKGGLGVSSLFSLNRGLMFKWIWRFYSQDRSLWVRVIKAIYGNEGNMGGRDISGYSSTWMNIVNEAYSMISKGFDFFKFLRFKLGNGETARFWDDRWMEDDILKLRFLHLYALDTCKDGTVATKLAYASLDCSFRRCPRGGAEQMQFEELLADIQKVRLTPMVDRKEIDDKLVLEGAHKTRWCKFVPIKINVFGWKVMTDSLPSRFNVSRRGITIDSIACGVFYVLWWSLWVFRNKKIFDATSTRQETLFDNLSTLHFLKILKNSLEVLKVLKNSLEVLKNSLEVLKVLQMELQENSSIDDVGELHLLLHNYMQKLHVAQYSSFLCGCDENHREKDYQEANNSPEIETLTYQAKETTFLVLSRMTIDILSVQATSVASESAFSTSGRVLSIRRTRFTLASLEMCMCLKDHLDAQERKQDKYTLETPVDYEEEILNAEVQENEAIPLSDEEITLDAASSEG
nr:RNA-directed DNA polymerase, eukaryota, reverse transcriptase zinc-binding domain protein [Tanacetum cinerariifolium]